MSARSSPPMTAVFHLTQQDGHTRARLSGDWILSSIHTARPELTRALLDAQLVSFDLSDVKRLDTAGALALLAAAGERLDMAQVRARPELGQLLTLVRQASSHHTPDLRRPHDMVALTNAIGRGAVMVVRELSETLNFLGRVAACSVGALTNAGRARWPALVTQIQLAGLDAIPIVGVTSFFIGAVIALLGVHMLERFGAQVFVVELIGMAVMREFAVIIASVLLAGRSASAFAAELGAMRMQQEVDALQVLGVDPIEALVLPRLSAMLITLPLLTLVAVLTGLLGGLLVTWASLDLAPAFFLQRLVDNVGITPLWIGLSKAPIMALVIAGIGCHQGMEVGGDVQSLGRRVTAAVVHAIFAIILIDAAFALVYMALNI
jgi:phospholipid/cholesterol/gamma-HCH transport system permease protein